MILYLLVPLLIAGVEESQTANVTGELSAADGNRTLGAFDRFNSTTRTHNVTSSSYDDKRRQIEEELQNNQTSAFPREDDENFQDQEKRIHYTHCDHRELLDLSYNYCASYFYIEMEAIGSENWCDLEQIKRPYNKMTTCMESISAHTGCYYPNSYTQDFFLDIHSYYFHNCPKEEQLQEDAPHSLVIALTLIPVGLIPFLVYMVIWKSKVQE